MTDQNALWPSHTGTITRLKKGRGPKSEFVSFTVEVAKKDGGTFKRDAIAFREAMESVLALGMGARVYIRGPLSRAQKTTATGQAYTVTSMTAITVLHKPLVAGEEGTDEAEDTGAAAEAVETPAPVAAADGTPALPEGATAETHQLYTKRDGAKAWRKRPARKTAPVEAVAETAAVLDTIETQDAVADTTAAVDAAPVVAETVDAAPLASISAIDTASIPDTALGAALLRALMPA